MSWSSALSASRAEPRPSRTAASMVASSALEPSRLLDLVQQRVERLAVEESKFEVLGARANGRHDLVRVGRREHEHDVRRRLLQRLQQRRRRRLAQLVDLVEDVDLPAARRPVPRAGGDVADVVDAVVRCGVEFGDVERRSLGDGDATRTPVTGVAVERMSRS